MDSRRFDRCAHFIEAVADLLREHLSGDSHSPRAVMFSGGRTPLPAYHALALRPPGVPDAIHILFSDERLVPSHSPENNARNILPLLEALKIPPARVHRVHSELPIQEAAERYDRELRRFFDSGGRVTLGLLGLGADGHTASLFSKESVEAGAGRLAIPVFRPVPPDRVSVTRDLLLRVERLVFLAAGPDKEAIIEAFLDGPENFPAGLAVTGHRDVGLWSCPEPPPE